MLVNGLVERVFSRENKGKTYYSLCIKGADPDSKGEDLWVSFGMKRPAVEKGDTVEFEAERDKKWWKGDPDGVKKVSASKGTAVASKGGWNDPDRQKSIVAQSAIKMAIDFVNLALANGGIALGNSKAADKFDIIKGAVKETATEFYWTALSPDSYFGEESPEDTTAADGDDDDDWNPVGD